MPDRLDQPNIVLVLMDDMGYGDMGCFGSRCIRTPRMDGVAAEGVKFTQMYSAAPVCTPARANLLTGRYAQRVGVPRVLFPDDEYGLRVEHTMAGVLKEAGYATCCVGKWHLGCREQHLPTRHGFDHFLGLLYSNDMSPLHLYCDEEVIEEQVDQATLTRRYSDEAIDWIEGHREQPFLLYLAHTMPHIPLHVEEQFRGRSAAGTYGDTIECIDHHLGRILDRLEELELAHRTLMVVTSDNGPWFEGSTGGLRGRKFDCYEGGVRMPFVARMPGTIPAGTLCEEPACFTDLLPTFASLAGAALPQEMTWDGEDIWSAFERGKMPEPRPVYLYSVDCLNAVRLGRWKLHLARGSGGDRKEMPQLFEMKRDPGESYNVANRHPKVVQRLRGMAEDFDSRLKQDRERLLGPSRPWE